MINRISPLCLLVSNISTLIYSLGVLNFHIYFISKGTKVIFSISCPVIHLMPKIQRKLHHLYKQVVNQNHLRIITRNKFYSHFKMSSRDNRHPSKLTNCYCLSFIHRRLTITLSSLHCSSISLQALIYAMASLTRDARAMVSTYLFLCARYLYKLVPVSLNLSAEVFPGGHLQEFNYCLCLITFYREKARGVNSLLIKLRSRRGSKRG